jgi:hypothetical protein
MTLSGSDSNIWGKIPVCIMVNDKSTKMSTGIVASVTMGHKQQTHENRVELRQTAFIKTWNFITNWNQIICWSAEESNTVWRSSPRKSGSMPWRWNIWPLSMMKWTFDEDMFSRRGSPVSVIADASSLRCKHSWANLHTRHAVNCSKFKNTVQYNLIHWRNKYSSFPRWRYVLTLSESSDNLYKCIYLCSYHNSFLLLLMWNFIPYIIMTIRCVKFW